MNIDLQLPLHDPEYHGIGFLYHYTTLDAFLSICSSRCLRATNVHYMNDARESELGLSLLQETVGDLLKKAAGVQQEFLQFLLVWLSDGTLKHSSVYVVCFSEARNQLSQWRGYAEHGRGVLLGFDTGLLIKRMQAQEGWSWHSCKYGRISQQGWINAILSRLLRESSTEKPGEARLQHFRNVLQQNTSELLQVMATIKDESFREEREVRFISPLISNSDMAIDFRVGKSTLVPFVEFSLVENKKDTIEVLEIIIGPSVTEQLTRAALISFAKQGKVKINTEAVSLSSIPYRLV